MQKLGCFRQILAVFGTISGGLCGLRRELCVLSGRVSRPATGRARHWGLEPINEPSRSARAAPAPIYALVLVPGGPLDGESKRRVMESVMCLAWSCVTSRDLKDSALWLRAHN